MDLNGELDKELQAAAKARLIIAHAAAGLPVNQPLRLPDATSPSVAAGSRLQRALRALRAAIEDDLT